mmetsp:Transcript_20329/g.78081  ORF Transcript_20329/g.78081 Transcript_20329/m.78081 type:complete len:324 (+) Transcript_20329:1140-2111(+)
MDASTTSNCGLGTTAAAARGAARAGPGSDRLMSGDSCWPQRRIALCADSRRQSPRKRRPRPRTATARLSAALAPAATSTKPPSGASATKRHTAPTVRSRRPRGTASCTALGLGRTRATASLQPEAATHWRRSWCTPASVSSPSRASRDTTAPVLASRPPCPCCRQDVPSDASDPCSLTATAAAHVSCTHRTRTPTLWPDWSAGCAHTSQAPTTAQASCRRRAVCSESARSTGLSWGLDRALAAQLARAAAASGCRAAQSALAPVPENTTGRAPLASAIQLSDASELGRLRSQLGWNVTLSWSVTRSDAAPGPARSRGDWPQTL